MRDLEKITELQQALIRWKQGSAEADSLIAGLSQNIVKNRSICITVILLGSVLFHGIEQSTGESCKNQHAEHTN